MIVKDLIKLLLDADPNARVLFSTIEYKHEEETYETVEEVATLEMMERSYAVDSWDIFDEQKFIREYKDSDGEMKRFFTRREKCVVLSNVPINREDK